MRADKLFTIPPFSLNKTEKATALLPVLDELVQHHLEYCPPFGKYVQAAGFKQRGYDNMEDIPFLPVSVFKNHQLKSIAEADVFKVLTSSGTTGQIPSKIFLDKDTANVQTKALAHIVTSVIGQERLPMLIIDSKSVLRDRASFSARGAGILGLSVFGKQHTYLLDDSYELNLTEVDKFLEVNNGKPMLLFGFTFMVWQFMFQLAEKRKVDLSQAILFHSGGWKKMIEMSVTNEIFKQTLNEKFGLKRAHNFYGMVEQVGSVFIENSEGHLHCSAFSDVIIRNPLDFSVMPHGEKGLIQVISVLPESYPGISLLTEDMGICHGEDNASNGWKGKYFSILGRAAKAELRGCSDTFK
ncbi:MAG: acyl-protein synthetase [Bacteroidota bacterium]